MIGELSHDIANYPEGIVLPVNKPYRWTSADVIRKLKFAAFRHFRKKNLKVGHAGTLDPLATGVLLVCLGPACKRAQTLQDHDKEYIAGIRFGATTPSYDLEKDVDRRFPYQHITEEAVREALQGFLGPQEQVAPLFSAKSIDGVRAYEMARKLYRSGRSAELDEAALETLHRSNIVISELELLSFSPAGTDVSEPSGRFVPSGENTASNRINVADTSALGLPEAVVRIVCSKGTYIRAFARDLGEALNSGAHLSSLVRSRSGDYSLAECLSMEQALDLLKEG
jgi:tRNA pseudouridine55 synthase